LHTFLLTSLVSLGTSSINLPFALRTSAFQAAATALLVSLEAASDFYIETISIKLVLTLFANRKIIDTYM